MTSLHVTYTECLCHTQELGWYREYSFVPLWDGAFLMHYVICGQKNLIMKEGEQDERSIRKNQTGSIEADRSFGCAGKTQ